MARFLLDTNAISEPARPARNPALMARLRQHRADMAISATTWHELVYGVARLPPGRRADDYRDYLNNTLRLGIPILPYDETAAQWHATERARLTALGRTPPFQDGQIAAVAFVYNLTLVTENVADFQHFEGIRVVNWKE